MRVALSLLITLFFASLDFGSALDVSHNPPTCPPGQRCCGRNFNGRRCCTPEEPCGEGEGDCDGPGDGGHNDGHAGCQKGLVCGSNNCKKFGSYYHEKDDCCERPSSGLGSKWGSWSSWSSCSNIHQQVGGRCRKTRTRRCQGQGCRASQDLQERYCRESSCSSVRGVVELREIQRLR